MGLYSPRASTVAGGNFQAEAIIQNRLDITNTVFANTKRANIHLHFAYIGEYALQETGSMSADLGAMRGSQGIALLRAEKDAKLVIGFSSEGEGDIEGIASRPQYGSFSPGAGFALVDIAAPVTFAVAHEIGHLFGMDHDALTVRPTVSGIDLCPTCRGAYDKETGIGCVMSTANPQGCWPCSPRALLHSSDDPTILWNGKHIGGPLANNIAIADYAASEISRYVTSNVQ
jgi:hypothetical protein